MFSHFCEFCYMMWMQYCASSSQLKTQWVGISYSLILSKLSKNELMNDFLHDDYFSFISCLSIGHTSVFIYSMPGYRCSVKERMLYSSCKSRLLEGVERDYHIEVVKKVQWPCMMWCDTLLIQMLWRYFQVTKRKSVSESSCFYIMGRAKRAKYNMKYWL